MKVGVFFLTSFFIFCTVLNAQEGTASDTVQPDIGQTENAAPEKVRLSWQAVEYALQYEVIVEKIEGGSKYTIVVDEIVRGNTEIECDLLPGSYRYQVVVYDLFERGTVKSDLFEFEVEQKTKTQEPLKDEKEDETKKKKLNTVTAAFEWTPIFSFVQVEQSEIEKILNDFNPLALSFRLSIIPIKIKQGNIGFELSPSVALLKVNLGEIIANSVLFGLSANILYQLPLSQKMLINARLGAGTVIFHNFYFMPISENTELIDTFAPLLLAALSFQNYFNSTLYIDVGAQYKVTFFLSSTFHFISPYISVGGRF